jgi:pyruvate-formate lyase
LLRSVAALDNVRDWPAGNTFNIKFDPKSVHEEGGVARMAALSSAFMTMGGQELQINVVDVATLRAAQEEPEAYSDLIVRVAGFSAYFTQLGRATQDEIISRTAHVL